VLNAGCSDVLDCTQGDPEFAVEVSFRDEITGELLTGPTPGMIQDGAYSDSLRISAVTSEGEAVRMGAGRERPGTYALTAKRDGYKPLSRTGIVVNASSCGVMPVFLDVSLEPE
jgi:hypothetical protein